MRAHGPPTTNSIAFIDHQRQSPELAFCSLNACAA
jgi:hypothetical protein